MTAGRFNVAGCAPVKLFRPARIVRGRDTRGACRKGCVKPWREVRRCTHGFPFFIPCSDSSHAVGTRGRVTSSGRQPRPSAGRPHHRHLRRQFVACLSARSTGPLRQRHEHAGSTSSLPDGLPSKRVFRGPSTFARADRPTIRGRGTPGGSTPPGPLSKASITWWFPGIPGSRNGWFASVFLEGTFPGCGQSTGESDGSCTTWSAFHGGSRARTGPLSSGPFLSRQERRSAILIARIPLVERRRGCPVDGHDVTP